MGKLRAAAMAREKAEEGEDKQDMRGKDIGTASVCCPVNSATAADQAQDTPLIME